MTAMGTALVSLPVQTQASPSLAAALVKAQQEVETAIKDKSASHFGKYVGADKIFELAGTALNNNGLALVPLEASRLDLNGGAALSEADSKISEIKRGFFMRRRFMLIHKSGESLTIGPFDVPAFPAEGRPMDNAWLGMGTRGLNYVYRDLLCIPKLTKEEHDQWERDEARVAAAQATAIAEKAAAREKIERSAVEKPTRIEVEPNPIAAKVTVAGEIESDRKAKGDQIAAEMASVVEKSAAAREATPTPEPQTDGNLEARRKSMLRRLVAFRDKRMSSGGTREQVRAFINEAVKVEVIGDTGINSELLTDSILRDLDTALAAA